VTELNALKPRGRPMNAKHKNGGEREREREREREI